MAWALGSGKKRFPVEIIGIIAGFIPTAHEAPLMAVSAASLVMMFWFLWGEAGRRQESVASQP